MDKFFTKNEQDVGYRIGDPTQERHGKPSGGPCKGNRIHSLRIVTPRVAWSSQKTAVRTSPRRPHGISALTETTGSKFGIELTVRTQKSKQINN